MKCSNRGLNEVIARLTIEPARLLGKPYGTLSVGTVADVIAFDPDERWVVTPESLRTKSKNTPLLGMTMQGRNRLTIVGGEIRFHG